MQCILWVFGHASPIMRILVMNDDGYKAAGIAAIVNELSKIATVTVVAPDENRSGASNSLTLNRGLRVSTSRSNWYHVDGTPTDCAYLALTALLEEPPDLAISGINEGANLGDMVIYSGTVAAAMEAYFLGIPAIAVSVNNRRPKHYETAARVARQLAQAFHESEPPPTGLINVNVPDLPEHELLGYRVTRLGRRMRDDKAEPLGISSAGEKTFQLSTNLPGFLPGGGTDVEAVEDGLVSITPLTIDMTDDACLYHLSQWLEMSAPRLGRRSPSPAELPSSQ